MVVVPETALMMVVAWSRASYSVVVVCPRASVSVCWFPDASYCVADRHSQRFNLLDLLIYRIVYVCCDVPIWVFDRELPTPSYV